MQTRRVAERSRRLNEVCVLREQGQRVQRRGMKVNQKRGAGNICRKAQADLLFRLLVSYKISSFIRNAFLFPKPLVSAEQCVCIAFSPFFQSKREESRWLKFCFSGWFVQSLLMNQVIINIILQRIIFIWRCACIKSGGGGGN